MAKITHIVCHYTATYPDQNLTAADIDKMHKKRGWKGIGYHWYIRRDGTVEQGRPESQVGAHVAGQNRGKIGICCEGGIERATGPNVGVDNRTPAQIAAQIKLIRALLKRYPGAHVVGHRDLAATQCPGFDVRTWWARVQKRKLPDPTPIAPNSPVISPDVSEEGQPSIPTPDEKSDGDKGQVSDKAARNGIIATIVVAIGAGAAALWSKWCEVIGLFCQ